MIKLIFFCLCIGDSNNKELMILIFTKKNFSCSLYDSYNFYIPLCIAVNLNYNNFLHHYQLHYVTGSLCTTNSLELHNFIKWRRTKKFDESSSFRNFSRKLKFIIFHVNTHYSGDIADIFDIVIVLRRELN